MKLCFSLFSISLNHLITDMVFFYKLSLVAVMVFLFIRSRIALLIPPISRVLMPRQTKRYYVTTNNTLGVSLIIWFLLVNILLKSPDEWV